MTKTAVDVTEDEMALYRATARRREAQEREQQAQRRARALAVAQQAAQMLKERFGAKRVILFGSLAQADFLHPRSDIDLAIDGVQSRDFWRAWGSLDTLGSEFEIDLIDIGTASESLRLEIEQKGIEL
ncbi:MAG: nucleotidyltransferase domain-containing protein [Anaerolineae bacterium]